MAQHLTGCRLPFLAYKYRPCGKRHIERPTKRWKDQSIRMPASEQGTKVPNP